MEEETTGQSKLFVILAVALIGLLVLGLVGIGGVFVIRQNMREQQLAAQQAAPTLVIKLPEPTPTYTPAPAIPTSTPLPTVTPTAVAAPGSNGEEAAISQADSSADPGETEDATTQKSDAAVETDRNGANGIKLPLPNNKPGDSAKPGDSPAATPSEVPNTGLEAVDAVLIALAFIGVLAVARRMRLASNR